MPRHAIPSSAAPALRAPPHSAEAERGVLGSALLDVGNDSRVLDLCTESGITPEAFFVYANRLLFETLVEMSRAAATIDPLTLNERLRTLNRLDEVGGTAYIQSLIDETPTAAHAEYYINIVRQKHLLRSVIDCARDAERRCEGRSARVRTCPERDRAASARICSNVMV